jgi:hypothetical protein
VWGSKEGFIGEEESKATNRSYHQNNKREGRLFQSKPKTNKHFS